jgi:signal transduction histidine kinase
LTDVEPTLTASGDPARDLADQESLERLRRLVETGIALSSELSLESLLQTVIETAVELTEASYGALGVIDSAGKGLEQFITVGIEPETYAAIGDLPRGRGLLGAMIQNEGPLRVKEISADSRSVGFPPGHPEMHSFLGVPIVLRRSTFGNLYLTEKAGGAEFTDRDEEIVLLLAGQAAVAIENARLYEASRRWSRQLESLNEVSELLVAEKDLSSLFRLAADRLRELVAARGVLIELPAPDGRGLVVEAASCENAEPLLGLRLDLQHSKAGLTFGRNRPERIDSLIDDPEVDQSAPRLLDATAALYVPLSVHGRAVGVMAAYDKAGADHRFTDADMRLAQAFANRVAVAVELSERVGREAVRALLEGQETERKRLARELHDETGQALASIRLGLKELEAQVGAEALSAIRALVGSALDDVRRLTVELRPPALDDYGLAAALDRLRAVVSERSGMDIDLTVNPGLNLPPEAETTVYRIVQEALTNIVKHAEATSVSIVVTNAGSSIRTLVEDDGKGFDEARVRDGALGIVGMRERVGLLGGRLEVQTSPGGGTTLVAEFPA